MPALPPSFSVLLASTSVAAFSPAARLTAVPLSYPSLPSTTLLQGSLQHLDDSNMRDLLFEPSEGKAVLVDACAPWCGPCKLIEPYLDDAAEKYSDRLSVVKYDVEAGNNSNLKVEMLLQGVRVQGLPTLLLYNNGNPLASHSGAITEAGLEEWLENNLFSKKDEFENEMKHSSVARVKSKENGAPVEDEVSGDAAKSRKGFVSFASQFEGDDYMLGST